MTDIELTQQEEFVYANYPTFTYKEIAAELGISPSRVGDIRRRAERKIRDAKLLEQYREKNKEIISIEIPRGLCFVILRGLEALRHGIIERKGADMRMRTKEKVNDPDYELAETAESLIRAQMG